LTAATLAVLHKFVVAHPDVFVIIVYNLFSQQHTLIIFIYYLVLVADIEGGTQVEGV
jgi:hypothetical protein